MKKQYIRLSLGIKISLLFVLMDFIVMGTFTIILYCYFQGTVKESVTGAVDSTISANNSELETLLQRIEIASDLVHESDFILSDEGAELPAITKMITEYYPAAHNENLLQLNKEYSANLKLFNDYFKTCFGEEESEYSNILFVDARWPIHVYMPKRTSCITGNGFGSNIKVKDSEWYQQAELLDGVTFWFVQEDTDCLCMAKLLKYRRMVTSRELLEENLGVLVVSFDIATVSRHLDLKGLTQDSVVLLLDQNDKIVYSNNSDKVGIQMSETLTILVPDDTQEITYEGKECMVNLKELPLGLKIVTIVPIDDIHQMTSQTIRIIVIVSIVMIGIAIFFTVFLSKTIISPLKEFARYMDEGNKEKFSFDHSRRDELGTLYRSFNHLMYQLEDSMERALEANEKKKQAELHALQAQINPHFIYNTLNSIACLAMLNKQEHIAELIGNLTTIMRYNISRQDRMVTVAEEIYTIRQYENIQKSCYRDSVFFEYHIDTEAESVMIPKLMIQPLIENALIHSVNYDQKVICVCLSVCMTKESLIIEVRDNGTEADAEKINQYITGQMVHEGDSLGVRNVYERMKLVFGDMAELKYEKDENGHTVARFRIPHH